MKRAGFLGFVALATAVIGTGCQPPPPRLSLTVTTTLNGLDDLPGDGLCTSADAGGACTLQAAISEGNAALDGADIAVPAGVYSPGSLTITGDVALNPGSVQDVDLTSAITVQASARFAATGIGPPSTRARLLTFDVAGRLDLVRSTVASAAPISTPPPLAVRAGGTALLADSLVITQTTASNAGVLGAVRSSMVLIVNSPVPVLDTTGAGTTYLLASSLQRMPSATVTDPICSGTAPVSLGYVHLDVACGGTPSASDSTGSAGVDPFKGTSSWFDPASPLIDAVPAGTNACTLPLVDLDGSGRGNDGDGDGDGACDVGAFEFQPAL